MTSMLTSGATVQTNISSDTAQKMAVDMSGLAHIMSILTNLYSNPSLAVLREYSVNALDAHVEAGTERPVEVTLPSELNPTLVIKDYGVGMSEADIYCIYAQYGASTKRDDETQVGGFGLGCKSALALTQQFTVTAVKDGRKTVVYFAQGSDGIGTVDTLLRASTDEPNGVEVSVPVSNVTAMVNEAEEFFSVWKPGTVLVNGQAPRSVWDSATKISEGIYLLSDDAMSTSGFRHRQPGLVVMGSVPYPMDMNVMSTITRALNPRFNVYSERLLIQVEIGDVEITPSREALNYSDKTKNTLKTRMEGFFENVAEVAKAQVASAATPLEAVQRAAMWRSKYWVPATTYTWNEREVPASLTFTTPMNIIHFANGSRTTTSQNATTFSVASLNAVRLVISGMVTEEHRVRAGRDIRDYVKGEFGTLNSGVALYPNLGEELDANYWLSDVEGSIFTHVSIDDIIVKAREYRRSQRQARTGGGMRTPRTEMSYPILDTTTDANGVVTSMRVSDILTQKAAIYYYEAGTDFAQDHLRNVAIKEFFVSLLPTNSILIIVEGSRTVNGLLRRIPQATPMAQVYSQASKVFMRSLSDLECRIIATDPWAVRSALQTISGLRPHRSRIQNKDFLALMSAMESFGDGYDANGSRARYRMFERYASMNREAFDTTIAPNFTGHRALLADYPLLSDALRQNGASDTLINHAIAYLNAIS